MSGEYGLKTGRPGPLTNTELRATPVEVTGEVTVGGSVTIVEDQADQAIANDDMVVALTAILKELKIMNLHLAALTGEKIDYSEVE